MSSRYGNRAIATNENPHYQELFDKRGVPLVKHHKSPKFNRITPAQRRTLQSVKVVWEVGDRYWKLASKYYDDPKLWWVIAYYNQKPTEGHVAPGDVILVPQPLDLVRRYMGV